MYNYDVITKNTKKAYDCEKCGKYRKFTVVGYNHTEECIVIKCNGCKTRFFIKGEEAAWMMLND